MKKLNIEKYIPAGIDYGQEIKWLAAGIGASCFYSLGFLFRFSAERGRLFQRVGLEKVLREGAIMADFPEILDKSLMGFGLLICGMVILAVYHYFYHYQGSKSIYLMRRLPDRWELWRRCLALPLLCTAAAVLLAGLLLLLYFGIYLLATPAVCLTPGQWQKIWQAFLPAY